MKFKSAWIDRQKHITVEMQELRSPGPGEVVVRIKACGICGTDIHFFKDFPANVMTPLGHEVAGYIEKVGSDITDLECGTTVVVQNHIPCGTCKACLNQVPTSCSNIKTYMNDQAGMGEYLIVPRAMVIPFEGLDFPEATLAEPITVALDLCREADVQLFDDVLVMGPGIIGLSCIKLTLLRGASHVVVVGHNLDSKRGAYRKRVALELGATLVVDSSNPNWKHELKKQFPDLFNRVIVTSPPATLSDGIEMAGFHGQIVFDGIDFADDLVSFHANDFHFAKKRLIASHAIPNWGFLQAFELLKQAHIPASLLVTHRFSFADLEKALVSFGDSTQEIIKPVVLID